MTTLSFALLVATAVFELARYDLIQAVHGFQGMIEGLTIPRPAILERTADPTPDICRAIALAISLYWKPVRCLQRSVCLVRLLRTHGVPARLVIGYRPAPFLSHAWVEVEGRVVNDSSVYQQRLRILCSK
jgi:hypothetical protein